MPEKVYEDTAKDLSSLSGFELPPGQGASAGYGMPAYGGAGGAFGLPSNELSRVGMGKRWIKINDENIGKRERERKGGEK